MDLKWFFCVFDYVLYFLLTPWVYVGISTKFLVLVKKSGFFARAKRYKKQMWPLGFQPRTCRNLIDRSLLFYHYARSTREILRFPKHYQLWFFLQKLAKLWQNTRKWCGEVADISATSWIPVNSFFGQTLTSTVLNSQKWASTMATKPPLQPPAAQRPHYLTQHFCRHSSLRGWCDIGQASALCPIALFLSYWDSRPSETTLQQRMCIPHSSVLFLVTTKLQQD
jgi:hypothetical protein